MDPKRKRRRFFVPLLASTGVLAAGGWAAVEYGGLSLLPTAIGDAATASSSIDGSPVLDGLEEVWRAGELSDPAAAAAERAKPAADPFLDAVAASVANNEALNQKTSNDAAVIARGQQPTGGAIDVPVTTKLPQGNPLRDRYETAAASEQQALARQFGGGRYGDPSPISRSAPRGINDAAPIPVEIGAESRIRPAAAEADPAPVAPLPVEALPADARPVDARPVASLPAAGESLGTEVSPRSEDSQPAVPAGLKGLPLVNVPIVPPTAAPSNEPAVSAPPAARVATNQPAYASGQPAYASEGPAVPGGFAPEPPLEPIPSENSFGGPGRTTPAAPRPGDPSLEGRQQPSLAVQKFAPENVQVGKPCLFMIKVRNDSPRSLADVVVDDHTPAGSRLVSTRPTAQTIGDAVRWQIGTLGPGEERTLEMEIVPTQEGDIGSVATVSFAAQASARASVTRPLLALRMSAPSRVLVGDEQRMQIEIRNPGSGDATGVVLSENVPTNLRHESGPSLEFEIGTLRAGETRRLELVMNAEAPGMVNNVLVARADGDLEVRQQVDFEVVAPQLAVAVQGPKRRFLQRPATYTVRLDNPGTAAARDIRLVAHLPRGMRFVKANNLGEYDQSTHAVYWALAELPQGEGGEVQVTALPTRAGEMTIKAEGQAGSGLRDESVHRVKIEGIAAVDFEVLDVEDPIEIGGETEYEVRLDNKGTAEATGVKVRFVAPPGMRVLSASGPTRHVIDSAGVAFDPLPRLAPRGENRYRVRVQADTAGDQRMTVEVTSDDLTQPVRKEEATRVFGDE